MGAVRRVTTPLLISALLLVGCGNAKSTSSASTATDLTPPKRASLPAKWYADADANGIPNFVERALGRDPGVDDCSRRQCPIPQGAAPEQLARARSTVIALDASGSMAAPAGGGITKMAAAKRAIRSYVRNTPPALDRFGFVVFGNRGDNTAAERRASCEGVSTLAPVGGFSGEKVSRVLSRFEPTGWTPIASALAEAGRGFRAGAREVSRILLVTDGLETCGGRPVQAARALQRDGVRVVVDVVGLDVDAAKARRLRAVAKATGGRYVDARTTNALLARFRGFTRESTRLASQLICLGRTRDTTTICQAALRDVATIDMSSRATSLRADGDEAGAREIERLVAALRERSDTDIAADREKLDRRIAEVQRQLDEIARRARSE